MSKRSGYGFKHSWHMTTKVKGKNAGIVWCMKCGQKKRTDWRPNGACVVQGGKRFINSPKLNAFA